MSIIAPLAEIERRVFAFMQRKNVRGFPDSLESKIKRIGAEMIVDFLAEEAIDVAAGWQAERDDRKRSGQRSIFDDL